VASRLAGNFITEAFQRPTQFISAKIAGGVSSLNYLVLDEVKADDGWFLGFTEMAGYRVTKHWLQSVESICLRENGMAKGARFVSALGRFLNGEYNFRCGHGIRHVHSLRQNFGIQRAEV